MVMKDAEGKLRRDGVETLNRAMERGVPIQRSIAPRFVCR
jgi:hypothetical protein